MEKQEILQGFELLIRFDLTEAKCRGVLPSAFKSPLFLGWDLTYRCTLNCIHCYNDSGSARAQQCQELSYHDLMRVVQYVEEAEVLGVCITGGDALLHKHFWDVAKALAQIPTCSASTITNGWLITPEVADRMARCFSAVQISLDGATAETHDSIRGRPGSFQRALAAVKYLTDAGVQTIVAFTAMKKNLHELPILIEMAGQMGVRMIEVIPLMLAGRAYAHRDESWLRLSAPEERFLRGIVATVRAKYNGTPIINLADTFSLVLEWIKRKLPNLFMHICPEGTVKMLPHISVSFGNIRIEPIAEIWNHRLGMAWTQREFRQYVAYMQSTEDITAQPRIPYVDRDLSYDELAVTDISLP